MEENQLEDRLVERIIDIIVEFRVQYGYGRKLDDPELHAHLVTLIQQYAAALRASVRTEIREELIERLMTHPDTLQEMQQ